MRREFIELGSTPSNENCAQVGSTDYSKQATKEMRVYINQLKRVFPNKPEGVSFSMKGFPHDFGTYWEVVVYFNPNIEKEVEYAYDVEHDLPEEWDTEARIELGL